MTILFDTETTTGYTNYRGFLAIAARESGSTMDEGGYWTTTMPEMEKFARAIEQAVMEKLKGQEPFGYFKAEPFGWTDCAETEEGAIALYEHPDPRIAGLEAGFGRQKHCPCSNCKD